MANNGEAFVQLIERIAPTIREGELEPLMRLAAAVIYEVREPVQPVVEWILSDIRYHELTTSDGQSSLDEIVSVNDTSVEQKVDIERTQGTTSSFSFTFGEGLKLGTSAKFSVGLPAIAGGEVEVSAELSFEASQTQTTTVEKSFRIATTVSVPPATQVSTSILLTSVSFEANFVATYTPRLTPFGARQIGAQGRSLEQIFPAAKLGFAIHGVLDGTQGTRINIREREQPIPPDFRVREQAVAVGGSLVGA